MRWIIACLTGIFLLFFLLPWAISASKKSARGKGRLAGATFAIGLAFGAIFDPAKSAAIENIRKKEEVGDQEQGGVCEPID